MWSIIASRDGPPNDKVISSPSVKMALGWKVILAEGNKISGNRNYGISIGHNDTDNVMRSNEISNSGKVGILFRDDSRGKNFWANRNIVEGNRILNSGADQGVAIDIQGRTSDIVIRDNQIHEKRAPASRIGIRIGEAAGDVTMSDNKIDGFAKPKLDNRKTL
jgi:hypothetical protein